MLISVVITTHNEGDELTRTVRSILTNTRGPIEVIIIDDGSTDDLLAGFADSRVRVIRHPTRVGVAASRDEGARDSRGDAIAFVDGHQRMSRNCLDHLARVSLGRSAISWPDIAGFDGSIPFAHGASFQLCAEHGFFTAAWNSAMPRQSITPITALRAPGYMIPRRIYERVCWPQALRGWGGSEAAVSLKAFFAGVPIVHACGPIARHLFRKQFPYTVTAQSVWRNQAIIARVCFDDRSWHEYWYPEVFQGNLSSATEAELDSQIVREDRRRFKLQKVRSDDEFWCDLLKQPLPPALARQRASAAESPQPVAGQT